MNVIVTIDGGKLKSLIHYAILNGYMRVDPQKAWNPAEQREAAKYAIQQMINKLEVAV